jgi:tetratricopeptide (TPR) repeat protein
VSRFRSLFACVALVATAIPAGAQTARISEELRTIQTYPFSDPNPIPILTRDARLYPYHSFEGYAVDSEPREWKVVRLENDYIEVFVLPEVGGKVWGAVVKKTGHEFIYRNEVLKFRNIALRGPWTSGGIEFNFGVIGHTPATATPVDYELRENPDGSVSAFVGAMDLPSRTSWRVEIRLPADKAYFETRALWYNPTPLAQPYYNWMTAAAFARGDLEMTIPGDAYLEHSGRVREWPVDAAGRYLPPYRNNAFDGNKSYHVVGELNDFFGGYYQDADYGFGHWARYGEMLGQKLWLWALSREGGVWEDLLTDTDGQYVEFQAGRLFVQYSPDAEVNPITQASFDPMSESRWTETWFPLEGIGGLTDASRSGAMHVSRDASTVEVAVNAFEAVADTLRVWADGRLLSETPFDMEPLGRFQTTVEVGDAGRIRVTAPRLALDYDSDPEGRRLARPFATDSTAMLAIPETDRIVFQARELMLGRRYADARPLFERARAAEPWNRDALLGLAEISYRSGLYDEGLERVNRALQLDAYDAEANFLAGTLYRAAGRVADARDAFGWAARSTGYRSAAYAQLAELMIGSRNFAEARRYARMAIDYDRYSVPGWRALAVAGRKAGDDEVATEALGELLELDPLHHFARAEAYLGSGPAVRERSAGQGEAQRGAGRVEARRGAGRADAAAAFTTSLGGEYPEQSLLELVVEYVELGLPDDAVALLGLELGDEVGPVARAWDAYLRDDPSWLEGSADPAFAFPFRTESLPVLEWAARKSDEWIWTYLLALNLWAVDRRDEAAERLESLGQRPDFGPAFAARGHLLSEVRGIDPTADLRRAVALDPEDRTLHVFLIRHLQERGRWEDAVAALERARARFPDDFNLALLEARAFLHVGRAAEAVEILTNTRVLPSESARESHRLYEQAHTLVALDAMEAGRNTEAGSHLRAALEWPESLGQGRPYAPEERLVRFLLARVEERVGNDDEARQNFRAVVDATASLTTRLDLLAIPAFRALGRGENVAAWARTMGLPADHSPLARLGSRLVGARGADPSALATALVSDTPSLFDDVEGGMILRALTAGGPTR